MEGVCLPSAGEIGGDTVVIVLEEDCGTEDAGVLKVIGRSLFVCFACSWPAVEPPRQQLNKGISNSAVKRAQQVSRYLSRLRRGPAKAPHTDKQFPGCQIRLTKKET